MGGIHESRTVFSNKLDRNVLSIIFTCAICGILYSQASAEPNQSSPLELSLKQAVSKICTPFVFDDADIASIAEGTSATATSSDPAVFGHVGSRFAKSGSVDGAVYMVLVEVSEQASGKQCNVTVKGGNPLILRKYILEDLMLRPEHFSPTKSRYYPGQFAIEDMLCASSRNSHPGGYVLMSAARPEDTPKLSILLTISNLSERQASCDHDGVQMNFRRLIETK